MCTSRFFGIDWGDKSTHVSETACHENLAVGMSVGLEEAPEAGEKHLYEPSHPSWEFE